MLGQQVAFVLKELHQLLILPWKLKTSPSAALIFSGMGREGRVGSGEGEESSWGQPFLEPVDGPSSLEPAGEAPPGPAGNAESARALFPAPGAWHSC